MTPVAFPQVSPWQQARALLSLRWQMIRTPGVKLGIWVALLLVAWCAALALGSGEHLDPEVLATAVELAPQAFLGFGVLAVIAPLTSGGGLQIVPAEHLVAFPVRPGTHFVGGLILAPANLIWALQLIVIAAETAYLSQPGSVLPGLATSLAYVLALTVFGQAFAWALSGLRATRAGRQVVLGLAGTTAVVVLAVIRAGWGEAALDASPTRTVVAGVAAGGRHDWSRWAWTTVALLALAAVCLVLGLRACAWSLRRPGDAGARTESRGVRRRPGHPTALRQLIALDRASVWRAPALRRGGLVLGLLPGVAAAGARVPWESLVVLPGLIAAGAGLLFGVNAMSLDGSGATWLATLPHDPRLVLRAKLTVLAETVLGAALLACTAGSLRSPGAPTAAEAVAVLCSTVGCTVLVVAICASLSVRHPHRADLRGPRDAIAPPGALVAASIRLAVPTGLLGLLLTGAAASGWTWLPPLVTLPFVLFGGHVLRRAVSTWDQPSARARVVQTVSAG